MKALFPVSLDNRLFSTATALPALENISSSHELVVIFVADRLQMYNQARKFLDAQVISEALNRALTINRDAGASRRVWAQRLRDRLQGASEIRLVSMDDISDRSFFQVYRNLTILRATSDKFRSDIQAAARRFCEEHGLQDSRVFTSLSEAYIIEELAANVRLRVDLMLEHEYYLGEYVLPLLNLYSGKYGVDVWSLSGTLVDRTKVFSFYQLLSSHPVEWRDVTRQILDTRASSPKSRGQEVTGGQGSRGIPGPGPKVL